MELINLSPYEADRFPVVAPDGQERLLVVVKATLDVAGRTPRLHAEQEPVLHVDEWQGEPGKSAVRLAGDVVLFKPSADVVLLGHAYTTSRDRTMVDVRLRAGSIDKTVRVFGERCWVQALGVRKSPPLAFERMPLVWERAFGGEDDTVGVPERDPTNPAGIGFRAKKSRRPIDMQMLPNLEQARALMNRPDDRPVPAGFGFVASHWAWRSRFAGTYGARWAVDRSPLLPDDFDTRYWQAAPPDQVLPRYLASRERVVVENGSPSGLLAFELPELPLDVSIKVGEETMSIEMRADTLIVDGDRSTATVVWRGSAGLHNRMYDVEWIRVAEAE